MSNSIMLGEIASLNATTDIRGSRITNATGGISFTTFHGPNSVTGDVLTACDETITDDRLGGMME